MLFNLVGERGTPGIGRRNREMKIREAVRAGEGRCSQIGFGIRP
ncbi:hypothetical protein [Clostridium sp. chh4-2]|nr:hypothetical protein [Clostridium sp. chh4-2]